MLGLNRAGDFANGNPITLPHNFGNPVTLPKNFGNPVTLPKDFGNPVTWPTPDPTHFGNPVTEVVEATPVFSPVGGTYTAAQSVSITAVGAEAIYYTTDGSVPTRSSTLYTGPISVNGSGTIRALAVPFVTGDLPSYGSATYVLQVPTPTFTPMGGSYTSPQSVTIAATGSDHIYYTTDGSTPTPASTLYTGAITVSAAETLNALAIKTGWVNSAIGTAAYTFGPTYLFADNVTDLATPSAWTVGSRNGQYPPVVSSAQEVSAGVTSIHVQPQVNWGYCNGGYACIDTGMSAIGRTFAFEAYLPAGNSELFFSVGASLTGSGGTGLCLTTAAGQTGLFPSGDATYQWQYPAYNGTLSGTPISAGAWHQIVLTIIDATHASWTLDGVAMETNVVIAGVGGGTWMGFGCDGGSGSYQDAGYVSQITIA